MKDQKLRAREFLLRTARVKDMRAAVALAQAAEEERVRQAQHASAEAAHHAVVQAGLACIATSAGVDMGRYALLSQLDLVLQQQLREASQQLTAATQAREQCAADSVLAKRYCEKTDERATQYQLEQSRLRVAKIEEDAIELWIEGQERL